jgi:uncharacterized protein YhbP (UPF0306 family)
MAIRLQRKTENPENNDLAGRIATFLDAHRVMSLATCGPCGSHAANVFYARDCLSLFWVSDWQSTHSRNIAINPQVSATIAPDYSDFDEVCGVQIFGVAHRLSDAAERHSARALLTARYPTLQRLSDRPMIEKAYLSAEAYRLIPNRIVMIDNRRGFSHKDTLDFRLVQKPRSISRQRGKRRS